MPSIDIDLYEIYQSCNKCEKEALVEWLLEDGHFTEKKKENITINTPDEEFDKLVASIIGKRFMLSNEEERTIGIIGQRFKYEKQE